MPGQWATPVTANACPKGTVLGSRRKTRRSPRIRPTRSAWRRIGTTAVAVNMAIGLLVALPAPAAYAQTSELTLSVISARTEPRAFGGAGVDAGRRRRELQVHHQRRQHRHDRAARPPPAPAARRAIPDYPGSCHWTSIAEVPHASPIFAQGDESDLDRWEPHLPDGRYLISVLADGYKLDGAHFTVPLSGPGPRHGRAPADAAARLDHQGQVFADIAPTNGRTTPASTGLAGFVGHITDTLGEVHDRRLRQPAVHDVRR